MNIRTNPVQRRIAAAICALAFAAASSVALADALPTKLTPGDGAVLATRPTEVSVEIAEAVSAKAGDNDLVVRDGAGVAVTAEHATVGASRKAMTLTLPSALPVGTYAVQWFTVSADDGHAMSGQWKFTYDPAKPASMGAQPPASAAAQHADDHADEPAARSGLLLPLAVGLLVLALVGGGFVFARRRG